MDNQQGPIVQHRELCSILYNNVNGKEFEKRIDTCITELVCCACQTNFLFNIAVKEQKETCLQNIAHMGKRIMIRYYPCPSLLS